MKSGREREQEKTLPMYCAFYLAFTIACKHTFYLFFSLFCWNVTQTHKSQSILKFNCSFSSTSKKRETYILKESGAFIKRYFIYGEDRKKKEKDRYTHTHAHSVIVTKVCVVVFLVWSVTVNVHFHDVRFQHGFHMENSSRSIIKII